MRSPAENKMSANASTKDIPPCPPGFDDDGTWQLVRSRTGTITGWYHHGTHGYKELPSAPRPDPIADVPEVKAARAAVADSNRRIDETRETWLAAASTVTSLEIADSQSPQLWDATHQPIVTAEQQDRRRRLYAARERERSTMIAYDNENANYPKVNDHLRRAEAQARRAVTS